MKTITISLEDDLYQAAEAEAARRRMPLMALVRDLFAGLKKEEPQAVPAPAPAPHPDPEMAEFFAMIDARPRRPGSIGPLNREEFYDRGVSGH